MLNIKVMSQICIRFVDDDDDEKFAIYNVTGSGIYQISRSTQKNNCISTAGMFVYIDINH